MNGQSRRQLALLPFGMPVLAREESENELGTPMHSLGMLLQFSLRERR